MRPTITFYNTLTRQAESLALQDTREPSASVRPEVKLYVCGPTVYDDAHLGHARCYLTWDSLVRFLDWMGYNVVYTRNLTDVDDKILNRAKANGESPVDLAQRYIVKFHEIMARLNTVSPTHEPKATEYVPQMLAMINQLIDKGAAYCTPSGTVYFDTQKFPTYGHLCNQDLDSLQSGARVDVDSEKKNPLDFALWKPAPKGEPLVWDVPWKNGKPGRPGWHIECSAMSTTILGESLDIHAGGLDLVFPHHQNEIAQSEACTGQPFVKLWMHNGFVNVSGEKMSKSLGNFATIETLLTQYDVNTLRYFLLTHHYGKPVDFHSEALDGAQNATKKLAERIKSRVSAFGLSPEALTAEAVVNTLTPQALEAARQGEGTQSWQKSVRLWTEAMAKDLNTAEALAVWFAMLADSSPEKAGGPEMFLAFWHLAHAMGFDFSPALVAQDASAQLAEHTPALQAIWSTAWMLLKEAAPDTPEPAMPGTPDALLTGILELRQGLRVAKAWSASDTVRDRLAELGIVIKDRKDALPEITYA